MINPKRSVFFSIKIIRHRELEIACYPRIMPKTVYNIAGGIVVMGVFGISAIVLWIAADDWIFSTMWTIFSLYIGVVVIFNFMWVFVGSENILINTKYCVYSIMFAKFVIKEIRFKTEEISEFRIATQAFNESWRNTLWASMPSIFRRGRLGMIVFDIHGEPFAVAVGLTPVEAKNIAAELNAARSFKPMLP